MFFAAGTDDQRVLMRCPLLRFFPTGFLAMFLLPCTARPFDMSGTAPTARPHGSNVWSPVKEATYMASICQTRALLLVRMTFLGGLLRPRLSLISDSLKQG